MKRIDEKFHSQRISTFSKVAKVRICKFKILVEFGVDSTTCVEVYSQSYLQVAYFLGQLFNEMVGPDMIWYLTGGFSHLDTEQTRVRQDTEWKKDNSCCQ